MYRMTAADLRAEERPPPLKLPPFGRTIIDHLLKSLAWCKNYQKLVELHSLPAMSLSLTSHFILNKPKKPTAEPQHEGTKRFHRIKHRPSQAPPWSFFHQELKNTSCYFFEYLNIFPCKVNYWLSRNSNLIRLQNEVILKSAVILCCIY